MLDIVRTLWRGAPRFRWLALAIAGLAAASTAAREHAVIRLGRALAAELGELADGRRVELAHLDDRSGRDLGRDLRASLRSIGDGHPPALRAEAVLVESPGRLIVSARLTDPDGMLIGIRTVSEPLDDDWLDLRSLPRSATRQAVDVVARSLSGPLPEPVVDVAWVGRRLLLLSSTRLRLAEVHGEEIDVRHDIAWPRPGVPTRAPAGRLQAGEDGLVWALTNAGASALLLEARTSRLLERGSADALPAEGPLPPLRFRPGTNQLVAQVASPWRLLRAAGTLGVDPNGELVALQAEGPSPLGLRVGSALCPLWEGLWLASSAAAPGAPDFLQVLRVDDTSARLLERLDAPGSVIAVSARIADERAHVVAVVEAFGAQRLLLLELARREEPDLPDPST